MPVIPEISPEALRDELASGAPLRILDVREDEEITISRLDNIVHVPMDDVPDRLEGLDPDADWVVVCRSGKRSAAVAQFLMAQGYRNVRNLQGGMNGWAERVDPTMVVY
ncbi:rhodanese-like domain-containing protein [soil metagenome]